MRQKPKFASREKRNALMANSRRQQTTQSLFLANLARQRRAEGDAGTAILLALAALPDPGAKIVRPYVTEAELQLDGALRALRERIVLKGHEDSVASAAFSPDGKRIVTASADNTARLWDAETGKPIGEPLKGHGGGYVRERGVQPRRQAHRHRVCGQDGAAVGRRDRQAHRRAAQRPCGCRV